MLLPLPLTHFYYIPIRAKIFQVQHPQLHCCMQDLPAASQLERKRTYRRWCHRSECHDHIHNLNGWVMAHKSDVMSINSNIDRRWHILRFSNDSCMATSHPHIGEHIVQTLCAHTDKVRSEGSDLASCWCEIWIRLNIICNMTLLGIGSPPILLSMGLFSGGRSAKSAMIWRGLKAFLKTHHWQLEPLTVWSANKNLNHWSTATPTVSFTTTTLLTGPNHSAIKMSAGWIGIQFLILIFLDIRFSFSLSVRYQYKGNAKYVFLLVIYTF